MKGELSVVIPSLGAAGGPAAALASLGEAVAETILVHQGPSPPAELLESVDRVLLFPRPLGFARAANRGLAVASGSFVLLLNDDARLQAGALSGLHERLVAAPGIAAVQPTILDPEGRIDSRGIAWNRWWQAVQRDRGASAGEDRGTDSREVFGAHAAAVLYRRQALEAVAWDREVFDETLHTYYEDVELAGRLRARGWRSEVLVPATAIHLGGGSGHRLGRRRLRLLYGNRLLVLARFLGSALVPRLPRVLARDLLDARREPERLPGILAGWGRALGRIAAFARRGGYRLSPAVLAAFREPEAAE